MLSGPRTPAGNGDCRIYELRSTPRRSEPHRFLPKLGQLDQRQASHRPRLNRLRQSSKIHCPSQCRINYAPPPSTRLKFIRLVWSTEISDFWIAPTDWW